ncbi:MAG TPA: HAD family hydrolase [Solirubrobacterales bacterium]|nr:HAD family hydrolase [Solirubrobacterales bacterium]
MTRDGQTVESPVYVCDLDGTLLRSDGTLSDFARRGLNQLLREGILLTVASSRATPAIRALLAGVELRLPVIEFNGAFVSELQSGHHLASNVLSPLVAGAVVEEILATGVDPVISTWDGSRDRVHFGQRMNDSTSWYVEEKQAYDDPRLAPCDDLLAVARREEVASVVGFVRDEEAVELAERVRGITDGGAVVYCAQNYYCPGWTEVQVQSLAAEKGAAVSVLLGACGAADAEVVACGDHLNDLGLFAVAARSIAPANAHPAVLEVATEIVGSNDEDGIVRYLLNQHALP